MASDIPGNNENCEALSLWQQSREVNAFGLHERRHLMIYLREASCMTVAVLVPTSGGGECLAPLQE